jgi:tripartite-type tricarboxylate transporter receptor subunit TctC
MTHRRRALQTLAALTLPMAAPWVRAQARTIRLVVPYPPGGPLDIVASALADKVKDTLGTGPAPAATSAPTWWPRRHPTARRS